MPELDQNLDYWNVSYDWSDSGDEWSEWLGGTPAIWFGTLMPRIHAFVPTGTILEIAPGYGRVTQYLKDACDQLVVVDLAERCIDHCRERFADATNIEYHVNDGRSLDMVTDGSIDFAFSFDSLVHAEADVLQAYLPQLARKLQPDGIGFFHHSNVGRYRPLTALARRTPDWALRRLVPIGAMIDIRAWRAESVTAERFAGWCEGAGLACISQETINWESGPYLIDAFSTFTPRGSSWERPLRSVRNRRFRQETRRTAQLYSRTSFRPPLQGSNGQP
jgi:SAM-dependent methyltransferase